MAPPDLDIIAVRPAADAVIIKHYLAIWDSYGTPLGITTLPVLLMSSAASSRNAVPTEAMVAFLPSSMEISLAPKWPAASLAISGSDQTRLEEAQVHRFTENLPSAAEVWAMP